MNLSSMEDRFGSAIRRANSSEKTDCASLKEIPCFFKFEASFFEFHSNSSGIVGLHCSYNVFIVKIAVLFCLDDTSKFLFTDKSSKGYLPDCELFVKASTRISICQNGLRFSY